jgi:3-hydroxyacyl-CoA dehydrogenase
MNRSIKKVAVLGSGVMGSRIACHFANIGIEVLLLDIVPKDAGSDKKSRNKIVNDDLDFALKSSPAPLYRKSFAKRITTGNFDDDMKNIAECDWIIEVVIERLDIKKQVFENVEKFRKPGTLISSNTSGIPIHLMNEGRSEDFQKHFCGTHFFNPPRYLKLLEIIPTAKTSQEVINFLMNYGTKFLGKTTVLCKDTPGFIANRVGTYGLLALLHLVEEMDLTVDEVEKLTGPVIGKAKSATFRTLDIVGIDTLVHVGNGLAAGLPNDEAKAAFVIPGFINKMIENKWLGSKTGQGFFKKATDAKGKPEFLTLDLKTFEYKPSEKVKFATLDSAKSIENLKDRLKVLIAGTDKAGDFYRASIYAMNAYASHRIPEITDEIYKIDSALSAGYAWELGPFETWDALGVSETLKGMEAAGKKPAQWVYDMLASGATTFYKIENGNKKYYDIPSKSYKIIPGTEAFILLDHIRDTKTVWKNAGATVTDIGDGILNLEFHGKMNTLGDEQIQGLETAIAMAEKDFSGLVISNEGANFSAGANVGMIYKLASEQKFDELNSVIKQFQNAMMRVRYSSIPVVVAPHNMALGGGCELNMHSDKVVAHAETYMGLVEFGVGLIPGGGGTKEFAVRLSDELMEGDVELNRFRNRFLTIGQAKVSTSAHDAFDLGYLRNNLDTVVMSRNLLLSTAKANCIAIADAGYTQPAHRKDIRVLGRQALGMGYMGASSMKSGGYITEHDELISRKLTYVMCGGDLSVPTLVSEQYLLDLEREAFLSLCGEKKTLERLLSLITGGKILRN